MLETQGIQTVTISIPIPPDGTKEEGESCSDIYTQA